MAEPDVSGPFFGGPIHVHFRNTGRSAKDELRVDTLIPIDSITRDVAQHLSTCTDAKAIRWIHVPENNLKWVEACFEACDGAPSMDVRIVHLKQRPVLASSVPVPLHSLHLEPSCIRGEPKAEPKPKSPSAAQVATQIGLSSAALAGPSSSEDDTNRGPVARGKKPDDWIPDLSIYLPYISLMKWKAFKSMRVFYHEYYEQFPETSAQSRPDSSHDLSDEDGSRLHSKMSQSQALFLSGLLKAKTHSAPDRQDPEKSSEPNKTSKRRETSGVEPTESSSSSATNLWTSDVLKGPSQPRRTLDQFYYPALNNTDARDADQTISKWSGKGVGSDGKSATTDSSRLIMVDQLWCWVIDDFTIISSFPSGSSVRDPPNFIDLYNTVRDQSPKCKTAKDIQTLLVKEAIMYMFNKDNKAFEDLVETYRWVTCKKAAQQITCFQEYHRGYAGGGSGSVFNDRKELKLVLEVADIIDELKMIRRLLGIQKDIVRQNRLALSLYDERDEDLVPEVIGNARSHIASAHKALVNIVAEIDSINADALNTHAQLLVLLDLKSKAASLGQGQVVLLFTIVTIIFLPLSFFTSYFGQNVSELTGEANNPKSWDLWRTATPVTVVIVVLALLVAYYINNPGSPLWFWKPHIWKPPIQKIREKLRRPKVDDAERTAQQ
ncbi:hypothetical protein CC86DRAFT_469513 [Ophiobolus disseminans]|uniref:Cora-domain-containing protein n=1 Tax=Ophiobolus disseminans TaxID=1469910 RepID=A0A6A6ZQK3_9PLEO|nr:hypothetical protein CC86DRAFT_469513 [Ophiobolus disseminans]